MGKSKSPAAARGIAAYQKAMGNEAEAEPLDVEALSGGVKKADIINIEGLLKTGQPELPKKKPEKLPARKSKKTKDQKVAQASKYRRIAQFMVLIGSDKASKILAGLDPDQVEAISKEIVTIGSISPEEADAVFEEFRSLLSTASRYSGSSSGGIEEARRHLYAAFGPEKGEALLVKAVPEAAEDPFDFLLDFSGEQLALLFKNESPAACAMVFSRLPSKNSAAALANTSPARKLEIIRRIAHLKETSPEVIERAAAALRDKARHFGRDDTAEEIDGKGVLAEILKHSDLSFGGRLLEEMEESDPSLSREMKDRLYTLEDVINAADRPIQDKLRTMDNRDIALLLRGRPEAFTGKIYRNLSSSRRQQVEEESVIMGPVPMIETEAVAREFLAWFRLNREEGRILMLSDEDVFL